MDKQPTLFAETVTPYGPQLREADPCRNRHGGADTSEEAWKAVDHEGAKARVLAVMRRAGVHGATLFEVGAELGVPINTISGRITQLRADNEIWDTGQRRPGASGRPFRVYRAIVWRPKK